MQTFIQQRGEELLPIEGFPNYSVSNYGRVISESNRKHKERIVIKQWFSFADRVHSLVALFHNGKSYSVYVRRLVALAFHPESYRPDLEVCHRPDSNPMNNRAD